MAENVYSETSKEYGESLLPSDVHAVDPIKTDQPVSEVRDENEIFDPGGYWKVTQQQMWSWKKC